MRMPITLTFAQIDRYIAAQAARDEADAMTCDECFGELNEVVFGEFEALGVLINFAMTNVTIRNRFALRKAKAICARIGAAYDALPDDDASAVLDEFDIRTDDSVDYNSGYPLTAFDGIHDAIRDL